MALFVLLGTTRGVAQTVVFEGENWPEDLGWVPAPFCDPPRALVDGWFQQQVAPCPGDPLPGGQQEAFRRGLAEFVGSETFFLEWRAETDGPASEITGVAPASMVIAGNLHPSYHFTFARDQVRLIRSNLLPILYEPLVPDVAHVFRLELRAADTYTLYIDNQLVVESVPQGAFPPNDSAVISFRASCWYEPSMTRWDYVRFGRIPEDGSGDFNSDAYRDLFDFPYLHECFTNERIGINGGPDKDAGPGCRWADFDADADVDLLDLAAFQNLFDPGH